MGQPSPLLPNSLSTGVKSTLRPMMPPPTPVEVACGREYFIDCQKPIPHTPSQTRTPTAPPTQAEVPPLPHRKGGPCLRTLLCSKRHLKRTLGVWVPRGHVVAQWWGAQA